MELESANAFVVSLDAERTWFRYHHLFADLLRLELRRRLPEEVATLHRRASEWFIVHGQVAASVRHTQAAGDWHQAARLLADHAFSLTLDGQARTMQALLGAFPPGEDHPELALVRATVGIASGRLDEAATHLRSVEKYAETGRHTAQPSRQRRLRIAVAALNLSLAGRSGNFAGVIEQANFLAAPPGEPSDKDISLDNDVRAIALMNLGIARTWSLGHKDAVDAERHLRDAAVLAREIGRPYLEVACLARLGYASLVLHSFATTQRHCREAIALAEHYGWGSEPVIAPALVMLAGTLVWTGEFDEADLWLRRTEQALHTDAGPDTRLLLHQTAGVLHAGRGRHREALQEFAGAEDLATRLTDLHPLASRVTGWFLSTKARLEMTAEARAALSALDERADSAELRNARATICLMDGDPAGVVSVLRDVLAGTTPAVAYATVVEANLLAGIAHRQLGDQRAANQAAERALALAEADRLILPFALTGAAELLESLPRHETAHAALLADILDVLRGAIPTPDDQFPVPPLVALSPGELKVLRYLPTNLSRPEIAGELCVSVNTVSTHLRNIYAKLQVSDRSSAVQRARDLRLLAVDRRR
ncbi:LuxR C-terminal-related transcriptional regulator [Kribbella sp. NPDC059898]|uniref:LuxR C-terminal-related transcriptional regulator n=1 Tax=Kribbella sp. NPDC059898 TaxID=3346995 RepID=UPI00364D42A8